MINWKQVIYDFFGSFHFKRLLSYNKVGIQFNVHPQHKSDRCYWGCSRLLISTNLFLFQISKKCHWESTNTSAGSSEVHCLHRNHVDASCCSYDAEVGVQIVIQYRCKQTTVLWNWAPPWLFPAFALSTNQFLSCMTTKTNPLAIKPTNEATKIKLIPT